MLGIPASCLLPSCPREAVLVTRTGLVLPFAGLWPRGNDVSSQASIYSSAREAQEWSQFTKPYERFSECRGDRKSTRLNSSH